MPNESHVDGAPESASPFPPAFRWETSTQEAPTQVMGSVGSDIAFDEPAEQPLTDPPLPVGTPLGRDRGAGSCRSGPGGSRGAALPGRGIAEPNG